mmetsp:Transcript_35824/g.76406  ORF Transcript_35824/g.76406 Transcript_35824/m.76406 type:complete len:105 (+) Transcript_35824:171-485(+)
MASAAAVAKPPCHEAPATTADDKTDRRELRNIGSSSPPSSPMLLASDAAWPLNSMEMLERDAGMRPKAIALRPSFDVGMCKNNPADGKSAKRNNNARDVKDLGA